MNEVEYFQMLENQQAEEYIPTNISEMSDDEIAEYEEYCKMQDNPYTDEELNQMQKELDLWGKVHQDFINAMLIK